MPESIVGVLAAASIGAVWSSCSPDFGVQGVLDRFGQIEPKVLIACDGYYYNGKTIDIADKLAEIVAKLPTLRAVIVVPYLGRDADVVQGLNASLIHKGAARRPGATPCTRAGRSRCTFERLPFAHPLYVLFSSGTTGMPKCIVHSAGGTLLKHLCEHQLHADIKAGRPRVLLHHARLDDVELAGVGPRAAARRCCSTTARRSIPTATSCGTTRRPRRPRCSARRRNTSTPSRRPSFGPGKTHDLSSIRAVLSTGSPLAPESFEYVYEAVKRDVHLASMSGGTDICGCFVLGIPTKPV